MKMTRSILVVALFLFGAETPADELAAANRLERAIYLEDTVGDLAKAIELYRWIAADEKATAQTRNLANQRLAISLKKSGQPGAAPQQDDVQVKPANAEPAQPTDPPIASAIQEAVGAIEQAYAFPLERKAYIEKVMKALAAELDGESEYMTAEQFAELSHSFEQQLVGVGLQLDEDGGEIVVATPIPGSPAEKAGIVPGDRIRVVGETRLADTPEDKRLEIVVKTLRGRAGEPVTLEVQRRGEERTQKLSIVRASIQLESVRGDRRTGGEWSYLLDGAEKIGYIRILQFGNRTAGELRSVLEKLQGQEVKGLILDLRENPGGLLPQAVAVSDLFLESGKIATVRSQGDKEQKFEASAEGTIKDLSLAVLVNRHTGSSAEIVAACLQDHQRAAIVGERTFGRGIVQSLLPLKTTGGALRITTGVFHRPSGGTIHRGRIAANEPTPQNAGGVSPDAGLEVEFSEEELQKYLEYRQARDVDPGNDKAESFEDRQLAKALAHLREKISP
jgi:carboxyl-terminal processing protease